MKLGWYINRLRSMGPAEVLHRVQEAARKRASAGRHEGWSRYPAPAVLHPLPGLRARVLAATPELREALARATAATLSGQFTALGRDWPARQPDELFPADLWRLDPVTGAPWPGPETYTFDIDFRHARDRGDIKYAWEIGRLQFLVPLAASTLLDETPEAISCIEAAIASWHAANPPFRGIGWASGIEVAVRAISLAAVFTLAGPRLSRETVRQIGEILSASAFWLPRFPSRYSSANNHLVAELAGEFVIATVLGQSTRHATAGLVAETFRQILSDGAPAEQTPTYGAFTAELVLFCALLADAAGHCFPRATIDRLAQFAGFVTALGAPTPGYGDDDEGRVLTLGPEPDYVRSVAAAIAGFASLPGPLPAADDLRSALYGRPTSAAGPKRGIVTFAQGGLSVWHGRPNGRDARLTLDHGPLGYLSIAAHGHADALAITLSLDGQPVLVDPGTYLYGSGGAWRDWFRSTPAHNTLNIDGRSQSRMSGAFNWSDKAAAALAESGGTPDPWLRTGQNGYVAPFGRNHQRTLIFEAGRIAIIDQLVGGPPRAAEIVFQLAPGLVARQSQKSVLVARGEDTLLRIDLPSDSLQLFTGEDRPDGGWVSPRFGEKRPATRLVWRGGVGEGCVTSWLTPLMAKRA